MDFLLIRTYGAHMEFCSYIHKKPDLIAKAFTPLRYIALHNISMTLYAITTLTDILQTGKSGPCGPLGWSADQTLRTSI